MKTWTVNNQNLFYKLDQLQDAFRHVHLRLSIIESKTITKEKEASINENKENATETPDEQETSNDKDI